MEDQVVEAIIGEDMRTVGVATNGSAAMIGRFDKPIDPNVWRNYVEMEWRKGEVEWRKEPSQVGVIRAIAMMAEMEDQLDNTFHVFARAVEVEYEEGKQVPAKSYLTKGGLVIDCFPPPPKRR